MPSACFPRRARPNPPRRPVSGSRRPYRYSNQHCDSEERDDAADLETVRAKPQRDVVRSAAETDLQERVVGDANRNLVAAIKRSPAFPRRLGNDDPCVGAEIRVDRVAGRTDLSDTQVS